MSRKFDKYKVNESLNYIKDYLGISKKQKINIERLRDILMYPCGETIQNPFRIGKHEIEITDKLIKKVRFILSTSVR